MGKVFSFDMTSAQIEGKTTGARLDIGQEVRAHAMSNASSIRYEENTPIQLVLYGPGEAGKTTFAHRLMLMDPDRHKFDHATIKKWRPAICFNVLEGAAIVIDSGAKIYKRQFTDPKCKAAAKIVMDRYRAFQFNIFTCHLNNSQEVIDAIRHLVHKSQLFKKLLKKRQRFSLFETWFYFVEKLEEYPTWGGQNWTPSTEDILRARNRTIGAKAFSFDFNDQLYTLADLGGQKSERKLNLIFKFQMDCLLFFVSLTEHSETLFEDHDGNRLFDSLRTWTDTVSHKDFKEKLFILFLNKFDLFKQRYYVEKKPIEKRFNYPINPPTREMEEDENCGKAIEWFKQLYMKAVPDDKKDQVKVLVTSSFDEDSVREAMDKGLEFILENLEPKPEI